MVGKAGQSSASCFSKGMRTATGAAQWQSPDLPKALARSARPASTCSALRRRPTCWRPAYSRHPDVSAAPRQRELSACGWHGLTCRRAVYDQRTHMSCRASEKHPKLEACSNLGFMKAVMPARNVESGTGGVLGVVYWQSVCTSLVHNFGSRAHAPAPGSPGQFWLHKLGLDSRPAKV